MIPMFPFYPRTAFSLGALMRQPKPDTPVRLAKRAKRKAQRQARKRNRS